MMYDGVLFNSLLNSESTKSLICKYPSMLNATTIVV